MVHGQSDVVITGPIGDLDRGAVHGLESLLGNSSVERYE